MLSIKSSTFNPVNSMSASVRGGIYVDREQIVVAFELSTVPRIIDDSDIGIPRLASELPKGAPDAVFRCV